MEKIKHITAIQIIEQKGTNSVPFLVLCDDGELYYAKTMFKSHPPYEDLINEILCVYFLDFLEVSVIQPSIIKIPKIVFQSFRNLGLTYDKRYENLDFDNAYFFGSLVQENTTEIELYNITLKDKHDYNKYKNPTDFLKIATFDYWIGNMDRRSSNPNILLNQTPEGKFEFLPIDHTQAFAYQNKYKALRLALMSSLHPKSIFKTPISKSIINFADSKFITNFQKTMLSGFLNIVENIEFAFEQVPTDLGLSIKGKKKIKEILSDEERNNKVSQIYRNYIK